MLSKADMTKAQVYPGGTLSILSYYSLSDWSPVQGTVSVKPLWQLQICQ